MSNKAVVLKEKQYRSISVHINKEIKLGLPLLLLSDIFRSNKLVKNFGEIMSNLFRPLFEVSLAPASHPELHKFLQHVSKLRSARPLDNRARGVIDVLQ